MIVKILAKVGFPIRVLALGLEWELGVEYLDWWGKWGGKVQVKGQKL